VRIAGTPASLKQASEQHEALASIRTIAVEVGIRAARRDQFTR
jgi:hypothetical protein